MSGDHGWSIFMRTAKPWLCFALGFALGVRPVEAQATSAELVGEVITEDGSALPGVVIALGGQGPETSSDARGRFRFLNAPWGQVRLHARLVGFVPKDTLLILESGRTYSVRLQLARFVPQLDTVQVQATLPYGKPARYRHTAKFDDFYERRAKKPGSYFTREEIESSNRSRVTDIISSVPGVSIQYRNNQPVLRVARCTAPTLPTGHKSSEENPQYSWFALFVNGQRIRSDPLNVLAQLSTNEVETIEVYRGVSQLPIEAIGDACAAVFITTRYSVGSVVENKR